MADINSLKSQRDRFLAFSFASADLFLEVSEDGTVDYALGAAKSLTGIDFTTMKGQNWLDIFSRRDKAQLIALYKKSQPGQRCGPLQVTLDETLGNSREAIITGIRMPDDNKFYITLGFVSELMAKMAGIIREKDELTLLDKDDFFHVAQDAIEVARTMGQNVDMTMFDIPAHDQIKEKMGDENWERFMESVTELLASSSIDGQAAAIITEGRYSVLHDTSLDPETLQSQIASIAKESDPEGEGFEVESKTVTADLQSLSERETTKALIYTINEFERKGSALTIDTLNSGFKAYVSANAQKIHQFKSMVENLRFDLHFQPIIDMETTTLSHFEVLSRFQQDGSTEEWIIFAEDIGMAADFDIAVCERTINYLLYKASTNRWQFAINLSGQSIQNEQFFKTLMAKLTMHKELAQRMLFEITESNTITELEMVNHFIQELQDNGFKVCLDDFGAGAASFEYIQQLHVDYVKIDGRYTRRILDSQRDQIMVKNLCRMCNDLNIKHIAEFIETPAQAEKMQELGVKYGQGHYFGKAQAKPVFDPDLLRYYKGEDKEEEKALSRS